MRKHEWPMRLKAIRKHIKEGDFDNFLKWPPITVTMFVGDAPHVKGKFDAVTEYFSDWQSVVKDSGACGADLLPYAPSTSGSYVCQAYHLMRWQKATGKRVKELETIVEFGGGYGAMATVCRQLGFDGDYHIYDFEEMNQLQRYYLERVGAKAVLHNTLDDLPIIPDLLIACWSLSEAPLDTRDKFMSCVFPFNYLFAFQSAWTGINNTEYFSKLSDKLNGEEIEQASFGGMYAFGVK